MRGAPPPAPPGPVPTPAGLTTGTALKLPKEQEVRVLARLETVEEITRRFSHIEQNYTLSLDFVATVVELFCKNEKLTPGAYWFRTLLFTLRDYIDGRKHYVEVLGAALPGFKR